MLIAPLPAANASLPLTSASAAPAVVAPGAANAGDGAGQGVQNSSAQDSAGAGLAMPDAGGKSGVVKASAVAPDPAKSGSDAVGSVFAQALAASLNAQSSPAPQTPAAQTQGDGSATASLPTIARAASAFAGLLAPGGPLGFADPSVAQSGAGSADQGAQAEGIGANVQTPASASIEAAATAAALPMTPGLGRLQAEQAQAQPNSPSARSAQTARQGPAPSSSGGPSASGPIPPRPQNPSPAQADQDAPADQAPATAQPLLADVGDAVTPSAQAQPSPSFQPSQPTGAAKPALLSTNISTRGASAKASLAKIDGVVADPDQTTLSGTAQTATADASTTTGADLKNGGGDDSPAAQTSTADDSAAQTSPPTQPDASALAGSLQAQTAPSPQSAAPKADAGTVSQLSAQIVQTVNGGKSSFDLTLHPEGLGDVQVKVSVDRNGAVTASMSFNNPQAAAELGARAGDLKDALSQAGFTVADNGLSFNMSGQDQSGAGQGGWSQGSNPAAGRAFQSAQDNSEDLLAAVSQAAANLQRPSAAGLDIRI